MTDPEVAVIVAVPLATAVTSPADDTVATLVLDEAQVTVAPDMVFPPESLTVGVTVAVSPTATNDRLVGDRVTDAAAVLTVTAIVALTDPEVAVIVAVPLATAVMSPTDDTVAALVFDELQVTVAPDMAVPPESLTVGVMVAVSPTATNDRLVGDRVIVSAVWVTVTVIVPLTLLGLDTVGVDEIVAVPLATAVIV